MSKLNLLLVLNSYSDNRSSNAPDLVNFKWSRDIEGIDTSGVLSQSLVVPAGQTVTVLTLTTPNRFLYVESDQHVTMQVNGTIAEEIKPFVDGTCVKPGIYARSSDITSLAITNPGTADANIFFATVQ